jgi:hypothetical protein
MKTQLFTIFTILALLPSSPVYALRVVSKPFDVVDAKAQENFSPYIADCQRRLKRIWDEEKFSLERPVKCFFRLSDSGKIDNIEVCESPSLQTKERVLQTLNLAKFRNLPPNWPNRRLVATFTDEPNLPISIRFEQDLH